MIISRILSCLFVLSVACAPGCRQPESSPSLKLVALTPKNNAPEVEIEIVRKKIFHEQVFSYGRLSYTQKSWVYAGSTGTVIDVLFREGDKVKEGDTLFILDTLDQWFRLKLANETLFRAGIELQDMMISMGKKPGQVDSIILVQSGYSQALLEKRMALREFDERVVKSPDDGLLAEMEVSKNDYVTAGKKTGSVLRGNSFEVEVFMLPETSRSLSRSTKAMIYENEPGHCPFPGTISYISPYADEKGFVKVRIEVEGQATLPEGSFLKIVFLIPAENKIVIPKRSVVLRSGKKVAFTVSSGRAKWNSVDIAGENSTEYLLEKGLNVGDSLIVSGNLFLAHDAPVRVKNTNYP